MAETDTDERRVRIDWSATVAGAAAAVTVAVLLSTLGAAGTLIGAALGSVIATVSSALYKQGIESSRRRMADVQAAALQRVSLAEQNVRRAARRSDPAAAERELDRAHRHLEAADAEIADAEIAAAEIADAEIAGDTGAERAAAAAPGAPAGAPAGRWAELPWRRIAMLAAVVFVLALLAISIIELIAGRSVSTITGGTDGDDRTSIGGVFGGGGKDDRPSPPQREEPAEQTPTPTPTPSGPTPPSTDATSGTPGEVASPTATVTLTETTSPTPSATAPSSTPSPTPGASP